MTKGLDYYEALGLTRNADDVEIKRCFRRLALKYHPDINNSDEASMEFPRIAEAYDVLSDPKRKGVYDLHGEDALKVGMPGLNCPAYFFDAATGPTAVFQRFFGTQNPYEALNSISSQFEAMTTAEKPQTGRQKLYTIELTLEEIFHGCLKKVHHTRKTLRGDGTILDEQRALTIDVKPGLPDGTRFVFEGEGNRTPSKEPGPVVFVLKSKPHSRFCRRGASDLVHKVTLPLYQALVGTGVEVHMLDGRVLNVPVTDIVTPGYQLPVPGEGMPRPSGGKGTLILDIDLLFPAALSETQKMLLRSAFFLPARLSTEQTKAISIFEKSFKDEKYGWASSFVASNEGPKA